VSKVLKELVAGSRDLARRARKLAKQTDNDLIRQSLERYPTEVEAVALKLEQGVVH